MDLAKAILPDAVEVSGRFYQVKTGHSYWFRFSEILEQDKVYLTDADYLYIDEPPEDRQAGFDALSKFYYEPKVVPRTDGESGERILDYSIDSDLIYAAILQCYKIDLYEKQYHWHKVRAMIAGLHDTKLNEILGYRCVTPGKNKELAKAKAAWALPQKVDASTKEALDSFSAQFYNA